MSGYLIRRPLALCIALLAAPPVSAGAVPDRAKLLLEASGVKGGLVVVIGCGDSALLAGLRRAGPYLVHGLDGDPGRVAAARGHLRRENVYGPVTVSRLRGAELPFVDSLVNMIVVAGRARIPAEEMTRALAPKGVLVDIRTSKAKITRKAWPGDLDEWSHFLHDASNNAVSKDREVAPPQGLRWTCGPEFARSHEHFASLSAMVTAGGRIFTIIDEGPISSVYLPPQWKLVARDAFSGVLLWKSPIANWESHLRGFRSGPPEIGRLLVARGERVYASLGYGRPVSVLDAATGTTLSTLAGTGGARELLLAGGVLYVLADDMTAAQHDERRKWIDQTSPTLKIWYRFPRKAIDMYGTQRIVAVEVGAGEVLWKRQFEAPGEVMPTTMALDEGRICLQTVSHVVCLDAAGGKELWRSGRPVATSRLSWSTPSLVIHGGVVLTIDRMANDNADTSPPAEGSKWLISSGGHEIRVDAEMVTFSLADGKELWRAPYMENYNVPQDILVIDGVVWVGNVRRGVDTGFTQGRDLKTGKVVATIPPQKGWGHHRCYRNKATVRWILMGRGGTQFVDPKGGATRQSSWVRGGCQYGIMPANGLVYVPQHSCACSPKSFLTGFNALSPRSSAGKGPDPLERGPAYDDISNLKAGSSKTGWPTYRRDARRSGYQALPAPTRPNVAWTRKLSAPVTAPVAAGGMVVVAETDGHVVHALSVVDGKEAWAFVADGRIDSPPTLSGGLCLFGTRNGFVYCLRASDGALVWRFRAAARDRRLFADDQLESVWPVHGSVLVDETLSGGVPRAYFAAGRSSFMDGGIRLHALELTSGKVLRKTDVSMAGGAGAGRIRQVVLPDILSAQKGAVWMRGLGVDKNLAPVEARSHLFAPRGFLDDTWWHRTYWVYGTEIRGGYTHWPDVGNELPAGRLLAFDGGKLIYGYGRMAYRMGGGHVRADMAKGYKLFAEVLDPAPAATQRRGGQRRIQWTAQLPFVARSIVLTRDALLVAGGRSPTESAEHHGPGTFWVASREDGSERAACALPAPPVLDGVALTDAGVFVSTIDGSVVCLRTKNDE
jgi:outer membrane protein assembly factor BamB